VAWQALQLLYFLWLHLIFNIFSKRNHLQRGSPPKQQRLGAVQLRVAKTALAHRDYGAAIDLFGEAAQNQTTRKAALLQLGKLYGLTDNRQAELATYQTFLKEYPDHAETRDRTAVLSAQCSDRR
jgi:TolA-binding protein